MMSARLMMMVFGVLLFSACEDDPRVRTTDETTPGKTTTGTDPSNPGSTAEAPDWTVNEEDCDSLLEITVRDFDASHPDMQRSDPGWGPLAGVLEPTLGADRKPVFSNADGTHTWKQDQPDGAMIRNCWDSGPGTPEQCYRGSVPMFDGAESFYDWYHDTDYNQRFEKQLQMTEDPNQRGQYIYDSSAFFPLSPSEGFGPTPANDNPQNQNYLFTTEIHLRFEYRAGQKFTFRGDDDLWIFVNGKMALDIGGMHLPFEGTIDFDAMAQELGIEDGRSYNMDIFHAERRTQGSNFRIETNISCFVGVVV